MERIFVFDDYEVGENGEVSFHYIIKSEGEDVDFTEKLTFPKADFSEIPEPLRHRLLMNLSLVLGISYWKVYCPKKIENKNNQLTEEQAKFWNTIYTKGLGEFYFKNKASLPFADAKRSTDFRELIEFPFRHGVNADPVAFERKDRSLLLFGGGKDSIVAAELLKGKKKDFTSFVVNDYSLQKEVIKVLGRDAIIVTREIDPKLLQLKNKKGTYNGHVPISAIYAFIGLLAAGLYDYQYIISSNEKSSNFGNTEYLGQSINHQWSKSLEFETLFAKYVTHYLTSNISYFSLLRPLYEIKIAQLFTKYPKYFSTFSSCNKNFTVKKSMNTKWCRKCPKCAFVFATLGAFLPKEEVVKIFGKNLFADKSLETTYKELLGIKNTKPFECVGTPDEVKLAFYLAHKKKEFEKEVIMKMFEKEVLPTLKNVEELEKDILSVSKEHKIPKEFISLVKGL